MAPSNISVIQEIIIITMFYLYSAHFNIMSKSASQVPKNSNSNNEIIFMVAVVH